MPDAETEAAPRRRSACADAALRAEQARIERMSVEERIKEALSMGERFAWLSGFETSDPSMPDARRREQP